jgi:hypothetical protein
VPFPLLAHQAPVLPLKLWRPHLFSAVALCAGSIAPDLEYLRYPGHAGIAHSVLGQFVVCLPVSIAITWLVARFVGPALASALPRSSRWRIEGLRCMQSPLSSLQRFGLIAASSLIGSFSHVLLDSVTHPGTWACRLLPVLERPTSFLGGRVAIATELQLVLSALGALAALPLLDRVFGRRPGEPALDAAVATSARRPRGALLVAAAVVPSAIAALLSLGFAKEPSLYFQLGHVYVWGYIGFRASCAGFVGLTLAAIVMEWEAKGVGRTG